MKSPQGLNDWKHAWDARQSALVSLLGPSDGRVLHAMVPFHLGGQADVLCFREYVPAGKVYATCELLGEASQVSNTLGTYELAIAHRGDEHWGPNIIARLARYTCEARLEPGHTMEIGPAAPKGSTVAGLLFGELGRMTFRDGPAGVLLCIGITADELARCKQGQTQRVLSSLRSAEVYPFTDLDRASVPLD